MANETKAQQIANDDTLYGEDPDENSKIEECYIAAMAMGDFKDTQPISELGGWKTEPPTKDCTVLLYMTEQTLTVSRWNSPNKMFYDEYLEPIKHWLKWKLI